MFRVVRGPASFEGRVRAAGWGNLRAIFRASTFCVALGTLMLAGCRQDMHDQPKFVPLRGSSFFEDGRSARHQVEGTVSRSQIDETSYFATGMIDGKEGNTLPFAATQEVLERGQERFNIYCTPCHSRIGDGHGMIVQRGYYQAADFHTERLRQAPLGHFFNVITNGFGAMPEYRAELNPADRWAIVAYVRALQLSQHATETDAPSGQQFQKLENTAEAEGLPASIIQTAPARPATPPQPAASIPAEASAPPITQAGANGTSSAAAEAPARTTSTGAAPVSGTETASAAPTKEAPAAAGNAAAGKQIYAENCQVCHQPTRAGLPPVIPSLIDIVTRTGAAHIRETVTNGVPTAKPPMPSFDGKLSPADIDNLIAFLRTKP
jgi:mono/diheme cytochrome c family protein